MITKINRFHGYGSLNYVYRKGQVVRGPYCMIKFVVNPKRKDYRAAVVVSKKVHKSAVVRNRIRRRIYEIIRSANIQKNVDIVLVVFDEYLACAPAQELQQDIKSQLAKANLIS